MGRPGWEESWTVRVVWISFRPSEPETWVRILHGPPLNSTSCDSEKVRSAIMPTVVKVLTLLQDCASVHVRV